MDLSDIKYVSRKELEESYELADLVEKSFFDLITLMFHMNIVNENIRYPLTRFELRSFIQIRVLINDVRPDLKGILHGL